MRKAFFAIPVCLLLLLAACASPGSVQPGLRIQVSDKSEPSMTMPSSVSPEMSYDTEPEASVDPEPSSSEREKKEAVLPRQTNEAMPSEPPGIETRPSASTQSEHPAPSAGTDPEPDQNLESDTGPGVASGSEQNIIPEHETVQEPVQEPEPSQETEPEPAFDIEYWIGYTRSYGQSVWLILDSTATDCWDNPIIASSISIYLERDIRSRLDMYVADGFTYFSVWAQPKVDGRYDLYIGYA